MKDIVIEEGPLPDFFAEEHDILSVLSLMKAGKSRIQAIRIIFNKRHDRSTHFDLNDNIRRRLRYKLRNSK